MATFHMYEFSKMASQAIGKSEPNTPISFQIDYDPELSFTGDVDIFDISYNEVAKKIVIKLKVYDNAKLAENAAIERFENATERAQSMSELQAIFFNVLSFFDLDELVDMDWREAAMAARDHGAQPAYLLLSRLDVRLKEIGNA